MLRPQRGLKGRVANRLVAGQQHLASAGPAGIEGGRRWHRVCCPCQTQAQERMI